MVPLAETATLGLAPIRDFLSRTTKDTCRDSRVGDPTLQMAQQVWRDAMGLHLQGEGDGPPHNTLCSGLGISSEVLCQCKK